jgi:CubicO group peptidase (beta-lactamase class C family)
MAPGCDVGAFVRSSSRAWCGHKVYGYGYQVWLLPGGARRFVLLGIRGQMIFVDPTTKLIMVHTAVHAKPVYPAASAETVALWIAVVDQLGRHAQ